jgi:PAS domain S-box-containing protein
MRDTVTFNIHDLLCLHPDGIIVDDASIIQAVGAAHKETLPNAVGVHLNEVLHQQDEVWRMLGREDHPVHVEEKAIPGGRLVTIRSATSSPFQGQSTREYISEREITLYRELLQGTGDGVWELDLRTMRSTWWSGSDRLLGLPLDQPKPHPEQWMQLIPAEAAAQLQEKGRLYREGLIEEHVLEFPLTGYDGVERWLIDRGRVLLRDEHGLPVRLVGVITDITSIKRAERQLAETEQQLDALINSLGQAVMFEDAEQRIRTVNNEYCTLTGSSRKELIGTPSESLHGALAASLIPDERDKFLKGVADHQGARIPALGDRLDLQDGRILESDHMPVHLNDRFIGHLWIYRDITQRELLQQELHRSKELLDTVIAKLGAGIIVDMDGRIAIANEAFCNLFNIGDDPHALEGKEGSALLHEIAREIADPTHFMERVVALRQGHVAANADILRTTDGRIIERGFYPIALPRERQAHVFLYRDVTERYRLLNDTRTSQEQLSLVIDTMGAGIFIEGPDGRTLLANIILRNWFKRDEHVGLGHSIVAADIHRLMAAECLEPEGYIRQVEALRSGEGSMGGLLRLRDGRVLEYSHRPMTTEGGNGHLWVYHDVTARHHLEREKQEAVLLREQLLSAVASSTAELVHTTDVMNVLPAIFERIGLATEVHRVYLFENSHDALGRTISTSQRIEWNSGHAESQINNPELQDIPVELFEEFMESMLENVPFARLIRDIGHGDFRQTLEAQQIISILILPVRVRNEFWGFIGFDDCMRERQWSQNELAVLRSLSAAIAAAVERNLLNQELDGELEAQRTINRLNECVMGLQTPEELHTTIVQEIGLSLKLDHCTFHVPLEGNMDLAAHWNGPDRAGTVPADMLEVIERSAASRSREYMVHANAPDLPVGKACACLAVPILLENDLVGILGAGVMPLEGHAEHLLRMLQKATQVIALKHLQLRAFRLARQQDAKYQGIIANMRLGMVELDRDHRITAVNQKFTEISGKNLSELLGYRLTDLAEIQHASKLFEQKLAMRQQGRADAYELEVRFASGEVRHWLISGAPTMDARGDHTGSVKVILDITERKRLEKDLFVANIKANSSLQAKELFLANMSHEMRTPMNVVLGLCDALMREEERPEQLDQLNTMQQASRNLLTLTNDILELSRAGAGHLKLQPRSTSLARSFAHVEKLFRAQAADKEIMLTTVIPEGLAARHYCDPQRLDQILVNLVGNAVKFTNTGSVTLGIQASEVLDGQQQLMFTIADTGIGMSERFQERMFEPFSRDPAISLAGFDGSGLGLSICKHLVDRMGGSITINSELGRGTTVSVTLTLPVMHDGQQGEAQRSIPVMEPLPASSVLLVEDSLFNRKVVAAMLKGQPVTIQEAVHGAEALERICEKEPDLVLLDLRMPVMDGLEFLRILRDTMRSDVPVLALTAGEPGPAFPSDDVTDILLKPFQRDDLLGHMATLLAVGRKRATAAPLGTWKPDTLLEMVGQDMIMAMEIIEAFRHDAPTSLRDLMLAASERNMKRVGEIAHRMRPSVTMMGITGSVSLLEELMNAGRQGADHGRMAGLVAAVHHSVQSTLNELGPWLEHAKRHGSS